MEAWVLEESILFAAFTLRSQAAHGSWIVPIMPCPFLEFQGAALDNPIVEVLSSEMRVSCRRLYFEDTLVQGQQRHVKCSASKVENEHVSLSPAFLVESIGNCGCSWLVNDCRLGQFNFEGP